jgi:tetratricopeptide (TPR) repeat protein
MRRTLWATAVQCARDKDFDTAEGIFANLARAEPDNRRITLNQALLFDQRADASRLRGDNAAADRADTEALALYCQAMDAEPPIADAFFNAAFFHLKQQDFPRAKDCLETYLALAAESVPDYGDGSDYANNVSNNAHDHANSHHEHANDVSCSYHNHANDSSDYANDDHDRANSVSYAHREHANGDADYANGVRDQAQRDQAHDHTHGDGSREHDDAHGHTHGDGSREHDPGNRDRGDDDDDAENRHYKIERATELLNRIESESLDNAAFAAAYRAINAGDEEGGIARIRTFLEHNPRVWTAWFLLGWGLRRLQRWEEGRKAFEQALRSGDANADTRNELASCCMELGDLDAAEGHLAKALALEPENTKIMSNMGFLALKKGQNDTARIWFLTLLEYDPEDVLAQTMAEQLG